MSKDLHTIRDYRELDFAVGDTVMILEGNNPGRIGKVTGIGTKIHYLYGTPAIGYTIEFSETESERYYPEDLKFIGREKTDHDC